MPYGDDIHQQNLELNFRLEREHGDVCNPVLDHYEGLVLEGDGEIARRFERADRVWDDENDCHSLCRGPIDTSQALHCRLIRLTALLDYHLPDEVVHKGEAIIPSTNWASESQRLEDLRECLSTSEHQQVLLDNLYGRLRGERDLMFFADLSEIRRVLGRLDELRDLLGLIHYGRSAELVMLFLEEGLDHVSIPSAPTVVDGGDGRAFCVWPERQAEGNRHQGFTMHLRRWRRGVGEWVARDVDASVVTELRLLGVVGSNRLPSKRMLRRE